MSLGYEKAEDSVPKFMFDDNWTRTFRGEDVPTFGPEERVMIDEFVNSEEYSKLALYLTQEMWGYNLESDMAEFVIRELIRGNI